MATLRFEAVGATFRPFSGLIVAPMFRIDIPPLVDPCCVELFNLRLTANGVIGAGTFSLLFVVGSTCCTHPLLGVDCDWGDVVLTFCFLPLLLSSLQTTSIHYSKLVSRNSAHESCTNYWPAHAKERRLFPYWRGDYLSWH
jgi:hypothetical protein